MSRVTDAGWYPAPDEVESQMCELNESCYRCWMISCPRRSKILIVWAKWVVLQMLDDILPQTKRKARMEAEEHRNQDIDQVLFNFTAFKTFIYHNIIMNLNDKQNLRWPLYYLVRVQELFSFDKLSVGLLNSIIFTISYHPFYATSWISAFEYPSAVSEFKASPCSTRVSTPPCEYMKRNIFWWVILSFILSLCIHRPNIVN